MRRADRPRRRIDWVAEHRRCVVIVQTDPTGTAATGTTATATTAGPHGQPCAPPVSVLDIFVPHPCLNSPRVMPRIGQRITRDLSNVGSGFPAQRMSPAAKSPN